jgi:hypothetical protein
LFARNQLDATICYALYLIAVSSNASMEEKNRRRLSPVNAGDCARKLPADQILFSRKMICHEH